MTLRALNFNQLSTQLKQNLIASCRHRQLHENDCIGNQPLNMATIRSLSRYVNIHIAHNFFHTRNQCGLTILSNCGREYRFHIERREKIQPRRVIFGLRVQVNLRAKPQIDK